MKKLLPFFLLILFSSALMAIGDTPVVINEVDANTPGTDEMEFVELYGPANFSLDGMVLVFWNGSNDQAYGVHDLDGYSLDDNGFFVAGNPAVPNVDYTFPGNGLQNGADGVGLYMGDAADFEGTTVSNGNIVDAIVYGASDSDVTNLIETLLNPDQPLVDEGGDTGDSDILAMARIPDGGVPLNTDTYVAQAPTPGASNQQACDGGTIATAEGEDVSLSICIDETVDIINLENTGGGAEDDYAYVVTDENNEIIELVEGSAVDFNDSDAGTCRIWGLSYTGTLDATTTEPGDLAIDIQTTGECIELSSNFIEVEKIDCSIIVCEGATVDSDQGVNVVSCLDGEADMVTFSNTSETTAENYAYVITDESDMIVELLADNTNDFNQEEEGVYRVYGISYDGVLDATTTEAGDDAIMIETDGECVELSENYVMVTVQTCDISEDCGIFFSEYIEGSSNNKALEIYNSTSVSVSLSDYELVNCSNGCDAEGMFDFVNEVFDDAILMPGEVFVIVHPDADPVMLAEADVEFQYLGNGDDAFGIRHVASGEVVDMIGTMTTEAPSGGWTVSGVEGGTKEHTLVRNFDITQGTSDWSIGQDQWEVHEQDEFSYLGFHDATVCGTIDEPIVGFTNSSQVVSEDVGTVTVSVQVTNPSDEPITVEVVYTGGTATVDDDFTATFPMILEFPANSSDPITNTITITDDMIEEDAETIELMLNGSEEGYQFGIDAQVITIESNDIVIPVYDIGEVTTNDDNGVADSLDVLVELRGIVHGTNINPNGFQFSLIDETGEITAYSQSEDFGYTVTEGDSVHVSGEIGQYNGLTQIYASNIELIDGGHPLVEPDVVTELNESTESDLVRIDCVSLVDPFEWDGTGSAFNVELTDGENFYQMRIDEDVDLANMPAPEGTFSLIGLGGQFDFDSPYDEGYQILPRYSADIFNQIEASFETPGTVLILYDAIGEVTFNNTSIGGASYEWDFGDGETSDEENPTHIYEYDADEPSSYEVTLTVFDENGNCFDMTTMILQVDYISSVEEINFEWSMYPNPVQEQVTINANQPIESVVIYDAVGKVVIKSDAAIAKQVVVPMSELEVGIYLIQIQSGDAVKTSRLIKK